MIDDEDDEESGVDKPPHDPVLEVLGRLQIACANDSPASMLAAHMSLSCAGRLRSASSDGVIFEIPNPPETTLLGATAAVAFSAGQGTSSFVTTIDEVAADPDGSLLVTLALPESLRIGDHRRSTVRIPVPRGTVTAAIVEGPARGPVTAIDISLLGILLEVDAERAATLRVGDTLTLRLAFNTIQALVHAEVRRSEGRRFGLLFATEGDPPERMTQIMWRLQQARLPRR
jgi:hypothetical protein